MQPHLVSIIIPVYNTERTIARCIDSALSQTHANCEIVIVDDGSPDGAGAIADDYATHHANVIVIHKLNAGLAEARRSGVEAAHGKYIIHLDSDDQLLPDAVEFLYNKCESQHLDVAYGSHIRIDEKGRESMVPFAHEAVLSGDEFLAYNIGLNARCASWGSLWLRKLWQCDVYPPSSIKIPSEDVFINIKVSKYINKVGLFNTPVCRYYYNSQSLTSTGVLSRVDKWKTYFELVEQNLEERGLREQYEHVLYMVKIDRLAFYVTGLDVTDPWVQSLLGNTTLSLPLKHRLLRALMRWPALWEPLRSLKRRLFN